MADDRPFWVSENKTPPDPHAFIQWKGTDVCMDFWCKCGAQGHFDGDFAYTVKCGKCGTVYEMPCYAYPREVVDETHEHWRENPQLLDMDEE